MGLGEQNKRIHIGRRGGGGRKVVLFHKEPTNDYKLSLIFCLLKFYGKSKNKNKTLREVNKKLRFLKVCSFKSRQIYIIYIIYKNYLSLFIYVKKNTIQSSLNSRIISKKRNKVLSWLPTPTKVRLDANTKNSLDNIVKRLSSDNFKCSGNIELARQHRLLYSFQYFFTSVPHNLVH